MPSASAASMRSAAFGAETSPNTAIESLPTDCDGGPLAVGDAVELQNINAAPALNGKTGTVTVSAQIKFLRDGAVGFSRIDFHTDHCD